jgi:orotidine-5'-phosphate decarboxylase
MTIQLTPKEQQARSMVCLPLDGLATMDEAEARVEELSPVVGLFKVGKESYTRFGPDAVRMVQAHGANVFLDLKYHDIPNTVKGAADAATQLGVYMFNVHAAGGFAMMQAARQGVTEAVVKYDATPPKITAVTILTSIDQAALNDELNIPGSVEDQVLHLAQLANQADLDGVVCSAADLHAIKEYLPGSFMYVNPGIKGPNTPAGADQKRVFTPGHAVEDGSDILVIGRAITAAEDRIQAGYEVLQDMVPYL